MNKKEFGLWLKKLRERAGKTAVELSSTSSVSRQVIYKAEAGKESTRLTTLRDLYKPICKSEEEWVELVLLWTMSQDGAQIDYDKLNDAFNTMRERFANEMSSTAENLAYVLGSKSPKGVKLVKRVVKHSDNPGLQSIVNTYLDALEEARTV